MSYTHRLIHLSGVSSSVRRFSLPRGVSFVRFVRRAQTSSNLLMAMTSVGLSVVNLSENAATANKPTTLKVMLMEISSNIGTLGNAFKHCTSLMRRCWAHR